MVNWSSDSKVKQSQPESCYLKHDSSPKFKKIIMDLKMNMHLTLS